MNTVLDIFIYLNTIKFFLINNNFFYRAVYFLHENVIHFEKKK